MSSSSHGQGTRSVSNVHRTGCGGVWWSRYRLTKTPLWMWAPPAVTCSYLCPLLAVSWEFPLVSLPPMWTSCVSPHASQLTL